MSNNRLEIPILAILSLLRRRDRRQVAISSALWGHFDIKHTRFIDAIDVNNYTSVDDLRRKAIEDGFPEFEGLWGYPIRDEVGTEGEARMGFAPIAYAWSLCRYFRELADSGNSEFFMNDDMYAKAYKYFHVDRYLVRDIYNYPILEDQCKSKDIAFACFFLNTRSEGLPSVQPHVFDDVVIGTTELNLKAGFYSPYGARLILERLKCQISLGKRTPLQFLSALESVDGWSPDGVFSTQEPFFIEFPDVFLGSDIRDIPPLEGHLGNLFREVKPS